VSLATEIYLSPGIVPNRSGERVRCPGRCTVRQPRISTSVNMLQTSCAGRGAILAHLIGSGRSRAVWISQWQALHAPGLVTGISIDLLSQMYLPISRPDLVFRRFQTPWGVVTRLQNSNVDVATPIFTNELNTYQVL
jgi:hypothetical protein